MRAIRLRLLLPKLNVNNANQNGQTLLMRAIQQAKTKTIELLLQAGADVSLKDKDGHDALWYAQQLTSNNKNLIIKMLEKKKEEKI